jgi:hypothetical protein
MKISPRQARRLCDYLNFNKKIVKKKAVYTFAYEDPFVQSMFLIRDQRITKPVYSITELAKFWSWSRGLYSRERVRQLLIKFSIPIQNKEKKAFVYLCDLQKLRNELS